MTTPRMMLGLLATAAVVAGIYAWTHRSPAKPPSAATVAPHTVVPATAGRSTNPTSTPDEPAGLATREAREGESKQILARITAQKITANQPKSARQLLVELERLKAMGAAALPALSEFLASGADTDYQSAFGKIGFKDGKVPADFTMPPSLRLALLELAKDIGGPAAEELLARELKSTGRGVEAAYIAAALEQIAPGKYTATATAAARDLLAMPLSSATKSPLDRSEREYLYQILATAGDASQVAAAQAQVVMPDGRVDRGALRYLQDALGPASLDVAMRAWNDPHVPASQREPLARVALHWVGTDDRAEQFYQVAVNDPNLSPNARKNLVEDLNQDGFANPKQLGTADLALIDRRLKFIERVAPDAKDPTVIAAFGEAKKDLLAMREKALRPPKK